MMVPKVRRTNPPKALLKNRPKIYQTMYLFINRNVWGGLAKTCPRSALRSASIGNGLVQKNCHLDLRLCPFPIALLCGPPLCHPACPGVPWERSRGICNFITRDCYLFALL